MQELNKCKICHNEIADKKNSHIIPSFLTVSFASSNGTLDRDTEILYSLSKFGTDVYIGRKVQQEALERNFDDLTEDRINEYKANNVTEDFVFCKSCEKKLGQYLESPYSSNVRQGKDLPGIVAYMFWLSVLWRIDKFHYTNIDLPSHIKASLGNRLYNYFDLKDRHLSTESTINKPPFSYRIIKCDELEIGEGCTYGEYDTKEKIASLLIGNYAICFCFKNNELPSTYSFLGLEKIFSKSPCNYGNKKEQIIITKKGEYNVYKNELINKIQNFKILQDKEIINKIWSRCREKGANIPLTPPQSFIYYVLKNKYSDHIKIGEKNTKEHFLKCFSKGLKKFYNIEFK